MIGGSIPQEFKQAIIIPLIKQPSLCKEELSIYRPVSGLSYISKLLASQFCEHLLKIRLINPVQSAYKPHLSTKFEIWVLVVILLLQDMNFCKN